MNCTYCGGEHASGNCSSIMGATVVLYGASPEPDLPRWPDVQPFPSPFAPSPIAVGPVLVPCPTCGRHVLKDTPCPFCFAVALAKKSEAPDELAALKAHLESARTVRPMGETDAALIMSVGDYLRSRRDYSEAEQITELLGLSARAIRLAIGERSDGAK